MSLMFQVISRIAGIVCTFYVAVINSERADRSNCIKPANSTIL